MTESRKRQRHPKRCAPETGSAVPRANRLPPRIEHRAPETGSSVPRAGGAASGAENPAPQAGGSASRASRDRAQSRAADGSKAPAISRAAAVLRLLGKSDAPLGVQTIARQLGLVPSTCLHVLRALVAEEFVSFDTDTKRYALEAGVLTLARHWLRRNQFTDLAQPVLDRISQTFGTTTMGVHIVGLDHIIVVGLSQSGQSFHLSTQI